MQQRVRGSNVASVGNPEDTQVLIGRWRGGEADARDRLIARLAPDLSQIASARLRAERGCSLSTGDLVGEAVMRLIRIEQLDLSDRVHFLALASRLMRHILIDHARRHLAGKRLHERVELNTRIHDAQRVDLESLENALVRLGAVDPQLVEIVEMRYFGGMTLAEVAEATGLSEATVGRRWRAARAWLAVAMGHEA